MRRAAIAVVLGAACLCRGEPETVRIGGVDYLNLQEGASELGLRLARTVPDTAAMLKSGARPVARIADHSREVDLLGLRVFLGDQILQRGNAFYASRVDYLDRLVPRLDPGRCSPAPGVPRVIALDPGHGGPDHGAENHALNSMEKTYTLDVSLRLRKLLEAAGYTVVLTRDSDNDVPKPIRSEIANRAGADFFISIHFNSIQHDTTTTGVEVMLFPPRGQRSTDSWSPGHKSDAEDKPSPINASDPWNTVLAGALHRRLLGALRDGDRGEKFEHLAVLRGLRCPGVLVEPAFISSGAEGARLATSAYRDMIADALLLGIRDYTEQLRSLQPPSVRTVAPTPSTEPVPTPTFEPTRPSRS